MFPVLVLATVALGSAAVLAFLIATEPPQPPARP
jgi:hypothetical protein